MATWDDVSRLALELPGVEELPDGNGLKWEVRRKYFAWERPLRKVDLARLGDSAPAGPILGVRVADVSDKAGLLGSAPDVFFDIAHLDDYPAVLVLLDRIGVEQLREVLTDAWLCRAPKRLVDSFLAEHPQLDP